MAASKSGPRWKMTAGAIALILIGVGAGVLLLPWGLEAYGRSRRPGRADRAGAVPTDGHAAAVARGRNFLRQGRPKEAFEAVSSIRDEKPGAGQAMTVAGLALIQFREYVGARLALERALKLEPGQEDAMRALATLSLMNGNGVRGLELLRGLVEIRPDDVESWLAIAKVSHDVGDPSTSADAFKEVLARRPDHREALTGLIGCLLESGRSPEAAAFVQKAMRKFPDDAALLGLAARQALDDGRAPDALALADRAIAADPKNVPALLARSRAWMLQGKSREALPDAEKAVEGRPNDPGALEHLARVQATLGLADRAKATRARRQAVNERAIELDRLTQEIAKRPDDPAPRWQMGRIAAQSGQEELAAQCFRAALGLDPACKEAIEGLESLKAPRTAAGGTP